MTAIRLFVKPSIRKYDYYRYRLFYFEH